jgi:endonuclease YncB( thermonuclease family)
MRLILPLLFLSLCAPALAAVPDCAGGVEISGARIARVEKNGALILNDGRAVMLEGIRLPLNDSGSGALADEALNGLRTLTAAQPLTLTAVAPKEDRYDRVRVQAFGSVWLQTELLRRGLARVAISPDRTECASELYKAEKEARSVGRGLWALPAFAVRKPETVVTLDEGKFVIVEGRVTNGAIHDGRVFLDFSATRGFTATIAREDHTNFHKANPPPENLTGHVIRVRGLVQDFEGRPEIALSNPAQIEFVN